MHVAPSNKLVRPSPKSSFNVEETYNHLTLMAALQSSATSACLALYNCEVSPCCRWNTVVSASNHRRRSPIGLTMNFSGMRNAFPIKGTTKIPAVGPGPGNPSGGNLPIPNMPSWAKWVVGAVIVAIPIYRRMRTLEDKIEKTAEVAIEVIDTVAEATEKVAGEVTDAFPGNEDLKEAASKIKTVTDAIEEDAEKAEALIHNVDEIKKEVDSIVDPIIDKIEKAES